jgi:hypothetical protein
LFRKSALPVAYNRSQERTGAERAIDNSPNRFRDQITERCHQFNLVNSQQVLENKLTNRRVENLGAIRHRTHAGRLDVAFATAALAEGQGGLGLMPQGLQG